MFAVRFVDDQSGGRGRHRGGDAPMNFGPTRVRWRHDKRLRWPLRLPSLTPRLTAKSDVAGYAALRVRGFYRMYNVSINKLLTFENAPRII